MKLRQHKSLVVLFGAAFLALPVGIAFLWIYPGSISALAAPILMFVFWSLGSVALWRKYKALSEERDALAGPNLLMDFQRIMEDADTELKTQINHVQDELCQVRDIQGDAISGLVEGFTGLETQSRSQEELVRNLIDSVSKHSSDESGMQQFASEAAELVQMFVDSITAMSSSSMELVDTMNEMSEQIRAIDRLLGEIDGITEQTNLLALNAAIEAARAGEAGRGFAVVAEEVRSLSQRSKQFSDQIRAEHSGTKKTMSGASTIVGKMASRDLNMTLDSKERISEMMQEMGELNELVGEQLEQISVISEDISGKVGIAVRSLQFEDITTQLIGHMEKRVNSVHVLLDAAGDLRKDAFMEGVAENRPQFEQHVELLQSSLKQACSVLETTTHKPVTQGDMQNGSVELF